MVIKEEIIHILECLCGVAEGSRVDNVDKLFGFLHPLMVESVKLLGKMSKHYLSLVVSKPVFGVSDQVRRKPGCTATKDG